MKQETKKMVASFIVGGLLGGLIGAGTVAGSKASRLADDVHEVKQDFDKSKHRVADDYKKATKALGTKGKEVLNNVDAAELGESATEGTKEVGRALKDRLINEINRGQPGEAVEDVKAKAKAKIAAWKAKLKKKKEEGKDSLKHIEPVK